MRASDIYSPLFRATPGLQPQKRMRRFRGAKPALIDARRRGASRPMDPPRQLQQMDGGARGQHLATPAPALPGRRDGRVTRSDGTFPVPGLTTGSPRLRCSPCSPPSATVCGSDSTATLYDTVRSSSTMAPLGDLVERAPHHKFENGKVEGSGSRIDCKITFWYL